MIMCNRHVKLQTSEAPTSTLQRRDIFNMRKKNHKTKNSIINHKTENVLLFFSLNALFKKTHTHIFIVDSGIIEPLLSFICLSMT